MLLIQSTTAAKYKLEFKKHMSYGYFTGAELDFHTSGGQRLGKVLTGSPYINKENYCDIINLPVLS